MQRKLSRTSECDSWITTSQAFFSPQQMHPSATPTQNNQVSENNRRKSIEQYTQKMIATSALKALGKPTNKTNQWKTCSHNYLKKYRVKSNNHDILGVEKQNQCASKNEYNNCTKMKGAPLRNLYNVVNNQKIPQFYIKNRQILLPIQHNRRLLGKKEDAYNIISGQNKSFSNDFSTQSKAKNQNQNSYNRIFGRFYDESQQTAFWQKYQQQQKQKVELAKNRKQPPSYINRQEFILDRTKPIPEALKILDEKQVNAKKRYLLKYKMEELYDKRNQKILQQKDSIIRHKIVQNKCLQAKKIFNIINHNKNQVGSKISEINELDTNTMSATNSIRSNGFQNSCFS